MREVTEPETPDQDLEPEYDEGSDGLPDTSPDEAELPGVTETPEPQGRSVTPEEAERAFRKIEQSFKTYAASVERNHPSFAEDLIPCLLCPPLHPGFLSRHDMGRVPKEVSDAVQMFLGFAREMDYRPAPDTRTCGTCDGEGKVASGSHVPEHRTRVCPTCLGFGYEPPPGYTQNGAASPAGASADAAVAAPSAPPADVDEWGEPRILPDGRANPNFGRMPAHKIAVEPWGSTVGLVAQDVA